MVSAGTVFNLFLASILVTFFAGLLTWGMTEIVALYMKNINKQQQIIVIMWSIFISYFTVNLSQEIIREYDLNNKVHNII